MLLILLLKDDGEEKNLLRQRQLPPVVVRYPFSTEEMGQFFQGLDQRSPPISLVSSVKLVIKRLRY